MELDDAKIYNYARTPAQILEDMGGGAPPSISSTSLPDPIAHYKLDEQTGQVANNSGTGGAALNGTLGANSSAGSDDPTWKTSADCKVNGCASFDGGDFLEVADDDRFSINQSNQFTASAWFYASGVTSRQMIVAKNNTNQAEWEVRVDNNGRLVGVVISANGFVICNAALGNGMLTAGNWYHTAFTVNMSSSTCTLYLNGMNRASGTVNSNVYTNGTSTLRIGARSSNENYLNGRVDEVKIYNVALSEEQVRLDMNAAGSVDFAATSPQESGMISGGAGNPPVAVWELDEKVGSTAKDTSGNNLTGTINGATWAQGKVGSALEFDGVDDTVTVPSTSSLNPGTSDFTLEAWVRGNSMENSDIIIGKTAGGGCSSSYGYSLGVFDSLYPTLHFCTAGGSHAKIQGTTALSNNQWYHLAVVVDRDSAANTKMYVNGRAVTTTTANLASHTGSITNTANFTLGSESDQDGYFWHGLIDQVRVYNYARSPAQIAYDYDGGKPVAWWRFDECQGATVKDVGPYGYHGTVTVGGTGSQSSIGTCSSAGTAWGNGASGKFNSALSLDGTDDVVSMGATLNLAVTNNFSLGGWVKLGTNKQEFLISRRTTGGNASTYSIIYGFTSGKFEFFSDTGGYTGTNPRTALTSSVTAGGGTWHHVFWTYDGTTLRGYLDGVLDVSAAKSFTLSNAAANLYLGSSTGAHDFFSGQLDDMRIYNFALGDDQVKQVFNGGAIRFGE